MIEPGEQQSGAALWTFATGLYAAPGIEADCLALQEAGLDVMVVLALVFAVKTGRRPPGDPVAILASAARDWQFHVTGPLRAARMALKDLAAPDPQERAAEMALREAIKAAELEAERGAARRLERVLGPPGLPGGPAEAAQVIDAYAAGVRVALGPRAAAARDRIAASAWLTG